MHRRTTMLHRPTMRNQCTMLHRPITLHRPIMAMGRLRCSGCERWKAAAASGGGARARALDGAALNRYCSLYCTFHVMVMFMLCRLSSVYNRRPTCHIRTLATCHLMPFRFQLNRHGAMAFACAKTSPMASPPPSPPQPCSPRLSPPQPCSPRQTEVAVFGTG